MDYEKKYKEALERCREFYAKFSNKQIKEEIEEIFPELKESEDERINTFLHHTFTAQYLCKDKLGKWHGEPVVNILAWIEKQGEQKEATCVAEIIARLSVKEQEILFKELELQKPAEWSEEDERILSGVFGILESWDCSHTALDGALPSVVPNYISWLKSLKDRVQPQSQWKPSKKQMAAIECAVTYIKNVETKMAANSLINDLKKL